MVALLIGAFLVTLVALASCDTPPNVVIDDADPRIQYTGTWIRNPEADPMKLNYAGTLSLSNTPRSNATLTFEGAIQVAVVGSFPLIGTHAMKSQYTIDGTNLTQYWPPDTVVRPIYQQRFFLSETLSTDKHTLVITNAGEGFYLDYVRLYFPQSSSSSQPSSTPAPSPIPSTSLSQAAPTEQASSTEDASASPHASATLTGTPPSDSVPLAAQPSLSPTSELATSTALTTSNGELAASSTDIATPTPSLPSLSSESSTGAATATSGQCRTIVLTRETSAATGVIGIVLFLLHGLMGQCAW